MAMGGVTSDLGFAVYNMHKRQAWLDAHINKRERCPSHTDLTLSEGKHLWRTGPGWKALAHHVGTSSF